MKLIGFTINDWMNRYHFLSRWQGYDVEFPTHVERCIRRYRYSGLFVRYVFRTLEYAGRGMRPLQAYPLNDPKRDGSVTKIKTIDRRRANL